MITQRRLKLLMSYNPATGEFMWIAKRSGALHDRSAGYVHPDGRTAYRRIQIDGREYSAHRLAWMYVHGKFPNKGREIDHINRDGLDNRIKNLRIVTRSENKRNCLPYKGRENKGVYKQTSQRTFYVAIRFRGVLHYGGTFATAELANVAAKELRSRLGEE